jgi:hypothetical protein
MRSVLISNNMQGESMKYNEILRMNVCLSLNKFQALTNLNLRARITECYKTKPVDTLQLEEA